MRHILNFSDFLNESKNYQDEEEVIADAFTALNSKYGTKLSIQNFDLTDEYPTSKYYWSNKSATKDINRLKSMPEWSEIDYDYKVGDKVTINSGYSQHDGAIGEIVKIMPDNKTLELKIKHKVGNEYVKFEKTEVISKDESFSKYDSLEINITNDNLWRGSKYNVTFFKAKKDGRAKTTQALFSFPKTI